MMIMGSGEERREGRKASIGWDSRGGNSQTDSTILYLLLGGPKMASK